MSSSLVQYYRIQAQKTPDQTLFFYGTPDFENSLSWSAFWRQCIALSAILKKRGVHRGQRVGILAPSSHQWEVAQMGIFLSGGVVVGLDPHDSIKNYETIFAACDLKTILVLGATLQTKIAPLKGRFNFSEIDLASSLLESEFEDDEFCPDAADVATVIFTSGTTGEPKGIEYTHGQMNLAVLAIIESLPKLPKMPKSVCWLPLSNLFQRVINFSSVTLGGQIYIVDKPNEIVSHLKTINPHVFVAVPRFFEKVHDVIRMKIRKNLILRGLFFFALQVGRARSLKLQKGGTPGTLLRGSWYLADKLLLAKIRGLFGTNILFAISGSASLRRSVLEFYHSIGLLILEAYGCSENIIPNSINQSTNFKFGSVGRALKENDIKISASGEILVKGPGVFRGYMNQSSEKSFEGEYLRTGDLGHMDEDGFIFIEGRESEVFKTQTGRKIPAKSLEAKMHELPYVDTAITLGENRKVPVVLLTLDFSALAHQHGVPIEELWDSSAEGFAVTVLQSISRDLTHIQLEIPRSIRPGGFIVLTRKFTSESGEVTANLKLRRKAIERKLTTTLDRIFLEMDEADSNIVWFLDPQRFDRIEYNTTSGRARRWLVIFDLLRLASNVGLEILKAKVRRSSSSRLHRILGQIFRIRLGRWRGPLQKVGQMLSYMGDDLPLEFRDEVRELLRDGAPVNPHLIRSVVETELRRPVPLLFAEWDDEPLATGSIGQIHLAKLQSGEKVAVKVLIPGMEKIVSSNLLLLRFLIPIIRIFWRSPSIKSHFFELKKLLMAECNFRNEANHFELFAELFNNDENVLIPKVHKDLCTERVLVTSYIEGYSFEEFCNRATSEQRARAAETIWRFVAESINRYAVFNADPHPGNYIFIGDKVAVVDFGFCKKWPIAFINTWKRQTLSGCRGDFGGFERASRDLGYRQSGNPDFYQELYAIHREVFFEPWIKDQNFHFTHPFLKRYLRTIFERLISRSGVHIPVEFLTITRLYSEIFAIMAELDVDLNIHSMTIPYLEEPTVGYENQESLSDKTLAQAR